MKPNFAALRTRAGAKLKDIGVILAKWGFAEVAELEAGRTVTVAEVPLALADVILQRTPKGGALVASEGAVTVALDAALTPDLVAEGHANELRSILQQARKDAGLAVSDRIAVAWDCIDEERAAAIEQHVPSIAAEVLAVRFVRDRHLSAEATVADLNGQPVRFTILKA